MVDATEGNSDGQNYKSVTYELYAALAAKMSFRRILLVRIART